MNIFAVHRHRYTIWNACIAQTRAAQKRSLNNLNDLLCWEFILDESSRKIRCRLSLPDSIDSAVDCFSPFSFYTHKIIFYFFFINVWIGCDWPRGDENGTVKRIVRITSHACPIGRKLQRVDAIRENGEWNLNAFWIYGNWEIRWHSLEFVGDGERIAIQWPMLIGREQCRKVQTTPSRSTFLISLVRWIEWQIDFPTENMKITELPKLSVLSVDEILRSSIVPKAQCPFHYAYFVIDAKYQLFDAENQSQVFQ